MSSARSRAGWEALGPPGVKGSRYWRHASAVTVRHCGHPTALRPYYVEDPEGRWIGSTTRQTRKGRPIGLTFRLSADAQDWVDCNLWPTVSIEAVLAFDPGRGAEPIEVERSWAWHLPADWPFNFPALHDTGTGAES